jgi:hypothetical protein
MHPTAILSAILMLASALAGQAQPPAPMRYIHNAPESALDQRYVYQWKILETALERTRPEYGGFVLEPGAVMTEPRQVDEMRRATGALTVLYYDLTPEMERDLLAVRIPVDKGLVGYRVFLVRRSRAHVFAGVRTLGDLRAFTFGLGATWSDTEILRASGLRVVTGSSYEGLFDMLANGRFDAFPRGAVEVLDEVAQRRTSQPDLVIEPELLLHYPLPMYFLFSRTPEGERLAARAERGMRLMIADGTYDRIFAEYNHAKIEALQLSRRRIIRLANPLIDPQAPHAEARLWFDPATYAQPARQ